MAQGRVSAVSTSTVSLAAVAMLVMLLVGDVAPAGAATFVVGGGNGWTFNLATWPRGKTFRAGDTLVFNYGQGAHNVVTTSKVGYQKCTTPRGARVLTTGKDQVKLVKGQNFFICNFPGHCESGMKIAIAAK